MVFALVLAAAAVAGIIYASFFEWTLHRFVMHRPFLGMTYPYRTHGITHHGVFGPGKTYHLLSTDNKDLVTMAWWNGPVLVLLNIPAGLLAWWVGGSLWVGVAFLSALASYYVVYEYFHWCMHVPGPRWFQGTRIFKWINQHHRLHHLEAGRNLNVVLPLADFLLRTRLARAPIS